MAMLEYGAVPQELVDMSEELEALGGGDTRLASAEVHCRARPARAGAGGIIQEVDGGVAVRCAIRKTFPAQYLPARLSLGWIEISRIPRAHS